MEIKLDKDNFDKEVKKAKGLVLVDFWASWCGPCQMVAPVVEEVAKDYKGKVKVGKIQLDEAGKEDEHQKIASEYDIRGIPALKIFKDGEVVDEIVGVVPKEEITSHLDAQMK